jgi:hypothetical protein
MYEPGLHWILPGYFYMNVRKMQAGFNFCRKTGALDASNI